MKTKKSSRVQWMVETLNTEIRAQEHRVMTAAAKSRDKEQAKLDALCAKLAKFEEC